MWRYIPAPGAEAEAQSPEAQEVQEAQETPEDHATTSCVKLTADEESQSAGWLDAEDAAHERPGREGQQCSWGSYNRRYLRYSGY